MSNSIRIPCISQLDDMCHHASICHYALPPVPRSLRERGIYICKAEVSSGAILPPTSNMLIKVNHDSGACDGAFETGVYQAAWCRCQRRSPRWRSTGRPQPSSQRDHENIKMTTLDVFGLGVRDVVVREIYRILVVDVKRRRDSLSISHLVRLEERWPHMQHRVE